MNNKLSEIRAREIIDIFNINYPFDIFKFCDTEYGVPQSIQKVKVDGKSVAYSANLTDGEFTLTSSVYTPGDTVTVDYTGYNTTNPLDIISGPARTLPSSLDMVTTTIIRPSSDKCFLSLNTIFPTSPTPNPSTNTLPVGIVPVTLAEFLSISKTSPVLFTNIF